MADKDKEIDIEKKNLDINIDLNEDLGKSLETGFDALGQVFGGLVGAIKEAVGPEMMKSLETANWVGQVAECLEAISDGLTADGTIPAEPAGKLSFLKDQLDASVDGSKLEAQKEAMQKHLRNSAQALKTASTDAQAAASTLAHAAGYFKAAATSLVPIQGSSDAKDE